MEAMEDVINDKTGMNNSGGNISCVRLNRRLPLSLQLLETRTSIRRRIRNITEFLRVFKKLRKKRIRNVGARRMVIREKINMHLRTLHDFV